MMVFAFLAAVYIEFFSYIKKNRTSLTMQDLRYREIFLSNVKYIKSSGTEVFETVNLCLTTI